MRHQKTISKKGFKRNDYYKIILIMTTLNEVEEFLNIMIRDKILEHGKKDSDKTNIIGHNHYWSCSGRHVSLKRNQN